MEKDRKNFEKIDREWKEFKEGKRKYITIE